MMLSYHRRNGFLLVAVGFIVATLAIYFLMGHPPLSITQLNRIDDAAALQEFRAISGKHGMLEGFIPITTKMEDYMSDLSALRGKLSEGSAANIVDTELSSAKSYYYLLRAVQDSAEINAAYPECGGVAAKEARVFCNTSITEADYASSKITILSAEEKENLRENQLEIIQENKSLAQALKEQINAVC